MEAFTEVFAWGLDTKGQLGLGEKSGNKSYSLPKFCSYNIIIREIACGEDHSGFISSAGHIYTMGSNLNGKLGVGDKSLISSSYPCLIEALLGFFAEKISCGWGHSAAITSGGVVFTWGTGTYGALGSGSCENEWLPLQVFSEALNISCGSRHTGLVTPTGELFMCGSGEAGQLGTGKRQKELNFTQIQTSSVSSISCGEFHSGFLTNSGEVYTMGSNSFGQLGIGNKKSSAIPMRIDLPKALKLACGNSSAAITEDGLFVWGNSTFGDFLSPKKIRLSKNKILNISLGGNFGLAIDDKAKVFIWGSNGNGELAQGDYKTRVNPVLIRSLKGKNISKIAAGANFCICLGGDSEDNKEKTITRDTKKYTEGELKLIALLDEEKERNVRLCIEIDGLQKKFQGRMQDANSECFSWKDEVFRMRELIGEYSKEIEILKFENERLRNRENNRWGDEKNFDLESLRATVDELKLKNRTLSEDILIMHSENKFYCEKTQQMNLQQERLQNLLQESQTKVIILQSELEQKESLLTCKDEEIGKLKALLENSESKWQEIKLEKQRELLIKAKEYKEKTSGILAHKVPVLTISPQKHADKKNVFEPIIEAENSERSFKCSDCDKGEVLKEIVENSNRSDGFTFRVPTGAHNDDVKMRIEALILNRSRIEQKLQIMQNEQEIL